MTVIGILSVLALGGIALFHALAARRYRESSLLFQEAARIAHDRWLASVRRHVAIALALGQAQIAVERNDIETLIGALRAAASAASGDTEPALPAEGSNKR